MKFKKQYLLIIPIIIISIVTFKFLKDRLAPLRFSGTVEATQVVVSSRLSSNILSMTINEGDLVQKDTELLRLDCEDIAVTFDRLSDDFERAKNLSKSGAASKESMDKAKSQFREAEIKKDWCIIKSPVEGIVTNKFHEVGEYVTPGTKLFSILNKNDFWVYFYVPQNLINRFKIGESIQAFLPETNDVFDGQILKINETAEFTPKNVQTFDERARLVYGIKVKIQNRDGLLKPGMSLDLEIEK